MTKKVHVTKTFLPPLEEYVGYLERIWDNAWLTNQGPLLQEFEEKIRQYLDVKELQFVSNGTAALQVALKALDIVEGEIITTPFSYVATTSAILWERCKPVYVDIRPDDFCIDANKIEAAITKKTKAIMAVHVFGYPCDVKKIEAIARKHKLKVIYDGAHAFGVTHKGKSLLDYGDMSICSFHATKLFHTIEGGCIVTNDKQLSEQAAPIKHFGHIGDDHQRPGMNAKASEFQAAMGLCNLKYINEIIAKRKKVTKLYDQLLGDKFVKPKISKDTKHNYAYYPILFKSEQQLLKAFDRLSKHDIFPRRYFYPSLNKLPYVNGESCPVSEDAASRVACLPLYPDLEEDVIQKVAETLNAV